MYYQYPLEALARMRGSRSQLEFARAARATLEENDEILLEPIDNGLVIFAAHEEALALPVRALGEIYGEELEIRGPKVRHMPGDPPQEPIVHIRITARRSWTAQVLRELELRRARILEECVRGRIVVIRAEAPLALVVGLPALLEVLTDGDATCTVRLVRYSPLGEEARAA